MKYTKLLIIFISAIVASTGCNKKNGDEAMSRANLARTGVYHTNAPQKTATLKWKFKTEGSINSSPAITDGVVLLEAEIAIFMQWTLRPGRKNGGSRREIRSILPLR